ncbi:hypothetical protein VTK73DRAFT_1014 [Phialemonium thermophilum]|uniref:Uncharacterized protein n=1 Tax=Phialemonium thermophilum TaxID=223376 RepID=A0ABR3XBT8_9PEZI
MMTIRQGRMHKVPCVALSDVASLGLYPIVNSSDTVLCSLETPFCSLMTSSTPYADARCAVHVRSLWIPSISWHMSHRRPFKNYCCIFTSHTAAVHTMIEVSRPQSPYKGKSSSAQAKVVAFKETREHAIEVESDRAEETPHNSNLSMTERAQQVNPILSDVVGSFLLKSE